MIAQKAQSLYQNITQIFNNNDEITFISNQEILKIGNILNALNETNKDFNINVPKIVVVGTQSSGKSSVINRLVKMDILPIGKQMVTRTPLHLELIQINKDSGYLEFGDYTGGFWKSINKIDLNISLPTNEQINEIRETIEQLTIKKAGNKKNISFSPIYIRIHSPNVPNIALIDLPGLTMVACQDKGQPSDIKQQIQKLVGKYISQPETIILSVMAARTDLETDMGLDLIKRYDPSGLRTIGVITKIDLMNQGSDVCDYLNNDISRDLQLHYGYFALKNRDITERQKHSALESNYLEKNWLQKHSKYSKCLSNNRLGLGNLEKTISSILISKIRKNLPVILKTIDEKLKNINTEIVKYGTPIGNTFQEKQTTFYYLISELNNSYIKALEERGHKYNIGREVKQIFIDFRNNLDKVDPYINNDKVSDEYIKNCMLNCEGNHMSSLSLPIDVLEYCLRDINVKPLWKIQECCNTTTKLIYNKLVYLIELILKEPKFKRFPKLVETIKTELIDKLLGSLLVNINEKIEEFIEIEENYIWTNENSFTEKFQKILKKCNFELNVDGVRTLLSTYYKTYLDTVKTVIPKLIMFHIVSKSEKLLTQNMCKKMTNQKEIINTLKEIPEIENKRKSLVALKIGLESAKNSIQSLN